MYRYGSLGINCLKPIFTLPIFTYSLPMIMIFTRVPTVRWGLVKGYMPLVNNAYFTDFDE